MLTTQIITTQVNNKYLKQCIQSIKEVSSEIIICSTERIEIEGCRVISLDKITDYSKTRNNLIKSSKNEWNFYIQPYEVLSSLFDLNSLNKDKVYKFPIIENGIIAYETRLWHKSKNIKFINPAYEYLDENMNYELLPDIYSAGNKDDYSKILSNWIGRQPTHPEPIYYKAMSLLKQSKYKEFLSYADQFMFIKEKKNLNSQLLIQYYQAMVLFSEYKDANGAIKKIMECIVAKPNIAEFWCLLGDIYYHLIKDWIKAKQFYKNAIILGQNRMSNEVLPMEIAKYRKYPEQQIKRIDRRR